MIPTVASRLKNVLPSHITGGAILHTAGKAIFTLLSPGGRRGISIFIYHRVLPAKDPLFPAEVDQEDFDRDLRRIGAFFNVLPLHRAIDLQKQGKLPPRAACITFDDGYADNATIALPILERHGMHATFFIATGFLNGGIMWNDAIIETVRRFPDGILDLSHLDLGIHFIDTVSSRQAAIAHLIGKLKYLPLAPRMEQVLAINAIAAVRLPSDLMMSDEEVRLLHRAGMEIGGHTVNHPILASIDLSTARNEIAEGKRVLEHIIESSIVLFAYPNGKPGADYRGEHVVLVKELGFEGAVSTAWGYGRVSSDHFQMPRFSPWDRTPVRFIARMIRNMIKPASYA